MGSGGDKEEAKGNAEFLMDFSWKQLSDNFQIDDLETTSHMHKPFPDTECICFYLMKQTWLQQLP